MVKNLINFFIAVDFLLPQFLGLAVGFLQLLQPKPYITNIGFIRSLIGKLGSEGILKTMKDLSVLSSKVGFFFIILLKKTR